MNRVRCGARLSLAAAAATVGLLAAAAPATGVPEGPRLAERLVRRVDVAGANRHLIAFQRIADSNRSTLTGTPNRAAGTPGYDASAAYVFNKLEAAGFDVEYDEFEFDYFEVEEAAFSKTAPAPPVAYTYSEDFGVIDWAGSGEVDGPLVAVDLVLPPTPAPSSTSGCEDADFAGFPAGAVALIQRGTCNVVDKIRNAQEAGASGVVFFNEGQPGRTGIFLPGLPAGDDGSDLTIPAVTTTFEVGAELAAIAGATVSIDVTILEERRTTVNVIAETVTGRDDNVVMAGAHLDSVPEGPGINDNGSGSAALLETALELGATGNVRNKVRFAWWGAEELGLLGSEAYVAELTFEEQLDIALYLNFDMVASPNAAYFVYDGDNSDGVGSGAGPFGSAQIEQTFVEFIEEYHAIPTEGTDFSGRSDYGPFIAVGIPSGGLFTGAEGVKTPEQAAKWGGTAGEWYDPCYHQLCDNLGNLDREALDVNLDAIAWAVGKYGRSTEDINGVGNRSQRAAARGAAARTVAVSGLAEAVTSHHDAA